jgi:hypothetical protein
VFFHFLEFNVTMKVVAPMCPGPGCRQPASDVTLWIGKELQAELLKGWCCTVCWAQHHFPHAAWRTGWYEEHGGKCKRRQDEERENPAEINILD